MLFHKTKFLEPLSLNMPAESHTFDNRPVLRSRTQTFVDLSSRYSALPVSSSYSSSFLSPSAAVYKKREDSGLITTAYAIRVTAVNNHKDGLKLRAEDAKIIHNSHHQAAAVRVVTIKKPYVVDKPLPMTPVETPLVDITEARFPSYQRHDDDGGLPVKSILRETCSNPSRTPLPDVVEQAGELDVWDMQGKRVPFRDLYLPSSGLAEKGKQGKTMVIFIRRSFSCRQQLRQAFIQTFLSSLKSAAATLPKNTNLIIMWCGSHVRLKRLIESMQCPFPIYADPNGRIYQLLEKTCAATGVDSNRASVQQQQRQQHVSSCLGTTALTNLVQSARLIGEGNPLKSGGNTRHHIGAAFLFETSEAVHGASPVRITWSYRIANVSAHSEADVIRRVLGVSEEKQKRLSKTSTKSSVKSEREKPQPLNNKDDRRTFGCMPGLPAAKNSHRRTVSCTGGLTTWRPRIVSQHLNIILYLRQCIRQVRRTIVVKRADAFPVWLEQSSMVAPIRCEENDLSVDGA